ncbi:MAG: TolC family protein [Burkholderiales bacterium]
MNVIPHPLRRSVAAVLATALFTAGCSVIPNPFTRDQVQNRAREDLKRIADEQEPLTAPLTLEDATARAVKYNMEYRVRLMEDAAAYRQLDVAQFDMLPKLTANAGYLWRNNEAFSYGVQPNGQITTSPSTAQERVRNVASLEFSWNILDFGVSYYRAKQLANQALIADERRRKALQNLVQDTRYAWWRAESAQRLLPEIDALIDEINQVNARTRLIEARRLLPPLQIAAFRRSLLDLEQEIAVRRQELVQANLDLAALMNLRPGLPLAVVTRPDDDRAVPDLTATRESLEQLAIDNRPELREEGYKLRITQDEAKKQILSLLPNFGVNFGGYYDSNKFLVNNQWAGGGYNIAWNLVRAFSIPAQQRASKAQEAVDETRRVAVTTAILAQTQMSAVRYALLAGEYRVWETATRDDARIVDYLTSARSVGLETELEVVRARARLINTKVNRDLVYAATQAAIGRVYTSVGLDSLPEELASHDLPTLARELSTRMAAFEQANFVPLEPLDFVRVRMQPVRGVPGTDDEGTRIFDTSLQRIVRLSRIPVTATEASPFTVTTALKLEEPKEGARLAFLTVAVVDAAGKTLASTEQRSTLVDPLTPEQWRALGESAGYRIVEPLRRLVVAEANARRSATATAAAGVAAGTPATAPAGLPIR